MNKLQAKDLLDRYRQGKCTEEEQKLVNQWYLQATDAMEDADLGEPDYSKVDRNLRSRLPLLRENKLKRINKWAPYAAAIFISVIGATWMYLSKKPTLESTQIQSIESDTDIAPGKNRATLTLANGNKIALSEDQKGIIMAERITYLDGTAILEKEAAVELLSLSTPKGGTYQITLPDGSNVWLNAETTLKYPSKFEGSVREVELEGEAYFEIQSIKRNNSSEKLPNNLITSSTSVEKNSLNHLPFLVKTKGQTIEVLGTQFNVSAYANEENIKTSLVEGKVRLTSTEQASSGNANSKNQLILSAGEQGVLSGTKLIKRQVDLEMYTSWKDGFFYFNRLPTHEAVSQLARWYDLEVIYQGKEANINMFAYIERNKPLSAILKALEKSGLRIKFVQSGDSKQLIIQGEH
ncbi:FecR family protein [Sphingobacterium sp. HJSM2_6]|uniref:FecR family protein n=1 Tax=Sphingobacterium sp. HJSM2_6 TaxID=3366264 RepID=UPI003BCC230C